MPEPVVAAPVTAPEAIPSAPIEKAAEPETALTRTEVAELIATAKQEVEIKLKADLDAAYKAARRSESKGDVANAKLVKMEAQLEAIATRGMDDGEAKLWKAERAIERANEASTTVNQQQEYEQQTRAFQERTSKYLADEGIKADDPRFTAAFTKYAADSKTYDDWDKAVLRAAADVHKDEKRIKESEAKDLVEKAREDERVKLRNEQRSADGKLDKGGSASAPKVDFTSMSDEEFKVYDEARTAERLRRQRQLNR